ncbi:hypothetical protein MY011_29640 [Escherichia coli]|nr:hypothetical protein A9R49_10810 [Escherichia coli]GHO16731.1 hypothetical protein MY011_29640 [Escherichia coli]
MIVHFVLAVVAQASQEPEEYVQPHSGLAECHALQDAVSDAEPHQAEVLIVHFVLAVVAQAS